MLTLDHISKTFNPGTINEKRALDGLSLHLKPGDFVTVIGGNGAGKSTMLNAVAGVWPVDDGRVCTQKHPNILPLRRRSRTGAGDFFFRRTEFPSARQLPRKPPKFDRKVCAVFLPENTHKHRNL